MKLTLQTIKNVSGQPEYVLLPLFAYEKLKQDIDLILANQNEDYVSFDPRDFIKNSIALRRMEAKVTQAELAKQLGVSQAYISKIEHDDYKVTSKVLERAYSAINKLKENKQS